MTHPHPCSPEQLEQIKSGKRTSLLTNRFKKGLRTGDSVAFQTDTDECIVNVTGVYDGPRVNAKYILFTWESDPVGFEMVQPVEVKSVIAQPTGSTSTMLNEIVNEE